MRKVVESQTSFAVDPNIDEPHRGDYLVFGSPQILDDEIEEVLSTLRSGWIGTGPRAAAFEQAFRQYLGVDHVVAVNSCTAALHLAMVALNLRAGDEVIVPTMTFAATANAVAHAGGTPVFADVDRRSMCLTRQQAEAKLSDRTKAIIPVHFAGRACPMNELLELASERGLNVIEDCAHAIETRYHGRAAGTFGDFGTFSFYVTKNLVTGEGGMLTTSNPDWAARIKRLALHGLSADAWQRFSDDGFKHYEVTEPGFKYNMMDLQAALGLHQLARIEQNLERRAEIWKRYNEAFEPLPAILPEETPANTRHGFHLYTLLLNLDQLSVDRDRIQLSLHRQKIGTGVHYRALHLHDYYRNKYAYSSGDLPEAEWISDRTISLPLSPKLSDVDVEDVISAVKRTLKYYSR